MGKPADREITEVLSQIEQEIEFREDFNGGSDTEVPYLRRTEVLIRRLAREAGYELPRP